MFYYYFVTYLSNKHGKFDEITVTLSKVLIT